MVVIPALMSFSRWVMRSPATRSRSRWFSTSSVHTAQWPQAGTSPQATTSVPAEMGGEQFGEGLPPRAVDGNDRGQVVHRLQPVPEDEHTLMGDGDPVALEDVGVRGDLQQCRHLGRAGQFAVLHHVTAVRVQYEEVGEPP